ncbi:hypothetical protein, partial [Stutzerimonas frequens]|uniref:hypothetical protein n=1 Tax=Stutzerimonas frequens TaxID=2968969 RepID=UPI004037D7C4
AGAFELEDQLTRVCNRPSDSLSWPEIRSNSLKDCARVRSSLRSHGPMEGSVTAFKIHSRLSKDGQ